MVNNEILEKAKTAKSAEEIMNIMRENGAEDFSEETAKTYFDFFNKKSGELSDEELENAAGGCKCNGKTVVSCYHSCHCGQWEKVTALNDFRRTDHEGLRKLWYANTLSSNTCGTCYHLGFSGGTGYCEIE